MGTTTELAVVKGGLSDEHHAAQQVQQAVEALNKAVMVADRLKIATVLTCGTQRLTANNRVYSIITLELK